MKLFGWLKKQDHAMSGLAAGMAEKLGFPYRVFPAGSDPKETERAYFDAGKRGQTSGFTPVLLAVEDTLDEHFDIMRDDGYSAQNVLAEEADAEKGKAFLDERFRSYFQDAQDDFGVSYEDFIGKFEGMPERLTGFTSVLDARGRSVETLLVEVPTANPWEIAAYIPFGGWNECPEPAEMIHVLKYWYDRYGAVPAVITQDTMEMLVPAPVSEADAIDAAKEHYAFTPDRVDQGTESGMLSEVARSLTQSTVWYFWWD